MQRICRKCGHVNKQATGEELEPCPACDAIYSRVESAMKNAQQTVVAARPRMRAFQGDAEYLSTLREQSNYPTFRSVIQLFTAVGYIITGIMAIGTVSQLFVLRNQGVTILIVGLIMTAILFVMTRVFREVSLMVADGCDALIRMAERQEAAR